MYRNVIFNEHVKRMFLYVLMDINLDLFQLSFFTLGGYSHGEASLCFIHVQRFIWTNCQVPFFKAHPLQTFLVS